MSTTGHEQKSTTSSALSSPLATAGVLGSHKLILQAVSPLICEAILAHPQGDHDSLFRPVKRNGTAELSGHAPVHQLASEACKARRCGDRRAAPLGPCDHDVIAIGIAGHVQRAACERERTVFG